VKADFANLGALALAIGGSVAGVVAMQHVERPRDPREVVEQRVSSPVVVDARGRSVPVASYRRIVSLNPVADYALLALVEPERLIAIRTYTAEEHPQGWRFGRRPTVADAEPLEQVLSLQPDLVLLSGFADEPFAARLRAGGVATFDLGEMRGVASMLANVRTLGELLAEDDRARALERKILRDLTALQTAVPRERMPGGLYLSVIGDSFFGGTAGTSFGDVLFYGGVRDVAAEFGYRDWPQYSAEQLLVMNPALVVTQRGMGRAICAHSMLTRLAACAEGGRIVELEAALAGDPGLGLIEAAHELLEQVHGAKGAPRPLVTPALDRG